MNNPVLLETVTPGLSPWKKYGPLFMLLLILTSGTIAFASYRPMTQAQLESGYLGLYMTSQYGWKYFPGDDARWKEPGFNDRWWQPLASETGIDEVTKGEWQGVGWFRCRFRIDDSLKGKAMVVFIHHLGTAHVYLNGKLIHRSDDDNYSAGSKSAAQTRGWQTFTFDDCSQQVMAVRFEDRNAAAHVRMGFPGGFRLILTTLTRKLRRVYGPEMMLHSIKVALLLIPLLLALIHLLLFLFYRKMRENLYYSFCLIGFAGYFYSVMQRYITTVPETMVFLYRIGPLLNTFTVLLLLLTSYAVVYGKIPRRHRYFAAMAIAVGLWGLIKPLGVIHLGLYIYTTIVILECFRTFYRNPKGRDGGRWIIMLGISTLVVLSLYQATEVIMEMIAYGTMEPPRSFYRVLTYGGTVFMVCMSMYLSSHFARINKDLEAQLVQVKELSACNLEQERDARRREMERRLLEADNSRKTKELEEARLLQFSMLPKEIPQPPHFKISVFMSTASEVGGDYYDFHSAADGTLTAVIGDATGHGMKAGTMVTTIKGLFGTYQASRPITDFFKESSRIIKGMSLGNLHMALQLVRINDHYVTLSTAGMPPPLVFRKTSRQVESFPIKAPPLGAFADYQYRKQSTTCLQSGDILLMMSDGFPERFNAQGDMLGMDLVIDMFKTAACTQPERVIDVLTEAGQQWSGGKEQDDDITFIAVACN